MLAWQVEEKERVFSPQDCDKDQLMERGSSLASELVDGNSFSAQAVCMAEGQSPHRWHRWYIHFSS
jgi:hypothetical protein